MSKVYFDVTVLFWITFCLDGKQNRFYHVYTLDCILYITYIWYICIDAWKTVIMSVLQIYCFH